MSVTSEDEYSAGECCGQLRERQDDCHRHVPPVGEPLRRARDRRYHDLSKLHVGHPGIVCCRLRETIRPTPTSHHRAAEDDESRPKCTRPAATQNGAQDPDLAGKPRWCEAQDAISPSPLRQATMNAARSTATTATTIISPASVMRILFIGSSLKMTPFYYWSFRSGRTVECGTIA